MITYMYGTSYGPNMNIVPVVFTNMNALPWLESFTAFIVPLILFWYLTDITIHFNIPAAGTFVKQVRRELTEAVYNYFDPV